MIKTQIIGNIGSDAELITTQSGNSFIAFSVAVTDGYGEKKKTVWFKCTANTQRFEKTLPFLKKGTKVFLDGKETPSIFEGQNGAILNRTFNVNDLVLLGGNSEQTTSQTNSATPTQQFQDKTGIAPSSAVVSSDTNEDDLDLPF